ncbi:hypothetical protein A9Q84_01550 [Halobacteriovorax marinus]|uniref:Peptidase M14 domain-containing protein n=1 Tax=Halobacteriovorax marinus TaxID=97084 RepID=A0A1Y5FG56_9BACT|nr:hypothetical protein A9Q84_01550 [Halobacteriovorax marinus]
MNKILLVFLITQSAFSICVKEYQLSGLNLLNQLNSLNQTRTFYLNKFDQFVPLTNLSKINPTKSYTLQENQTPILRDYDDRYIKYYRYQRMLDFLKTKKQEFTNLDYKIETIGKSIQGRSLFSIYPKSIDPNKSVILMFGRHHGDEGTANWIIEGFVNNFLNDSEFNSKFQLVLYPMVNPDGAENRVRYNKNGRDLNRSWNREPSRSKDEIQTIQSHLIKNLLSSNTPVIALDMHGSFTEDFIYRVQKKFIDLDFYNIQQNFIDTLGSFDTWQRGNFKHSNGHPKMARILLVRDYKLNALTHETQRDISLNANRTLEDVLKQGRDVLNSIKLLY